MSFLVTAFGLTGMAATLTAGAVYGGLTTVGMNLIRGNDPFDNIGQGILMGGITGGIFGGAGAAAGVGEGTVAGATFDAAGNTIPIKDMATTAFSDNAAANLGSKYGGTNMLAGMPVSDPYSLTPVANSIYGGSSSLAVPTPDVYLGDQQFPGDPEAAMQARQYGAMQQTQGLISMPPAPEAAAPITVEPPASTTSMRLNTQNPLGGYTDQFGRSLDATGAPISNGAAAPKTSTTSPTTTSPKFTEDPFGYLTHKDNRGTAMLGGLGLAGAMGAFNPKTGLNNLPPRSYQRVNTSYNPGTVNPNYGQPGQPYFVGQGYGPQTRETYYGAAGGGIRALSGGDLIAPYVPMTDRGGTNKPSPKSLEGSSPFKDYLASTGPNENDDPYAGAADGLKRLSPGALQRIIDGTDTIAAGLAQNELYERQAHAPISRGDIEGMKKMAEGGLSNLPSAYQQPQYQMSDFANSPLFQPTGGNAPVQPGISEYIANLNQRSYAPPAAVAAPAVTDTTSPTIYNPATQTYSTNPNLAVPAASVNDGASYSDAQGGDYPGQFGGGAGDNSDKAGGPIASKRYAMGGLAALPEYAAGGKLLSGDGDGMSDSIPAVIKGERPQRAALADGEFVIPADVVSHLGNGSTKAGGKRLYEMMANIRKARTGNSKQGKQINPMKFIPA